MTNDRVFVCPNGARIFNLDKAEAAIGVPLSIVGDAIHPDDQPVVWSQMRAGLDGGVVDVTCRIRSGRKSYRRFHAIGGGMRDAEGSIVRVPGVLIDITEDAAARDSSQLDAACDHLLLARAAALRCGDVALATLCEVALRQAIASAWASPTWS